MGGGGGPREPEWPRRKAFGEPGGARGALAPSLAAQPPPQPPSFPEECLLHLKVRLAGQPTDASPPPGPPPRGLRTSIPTALPHLLLPCSLLLSGSCSRQLDGGAELHDLPPPSAPPLPSWPSGPPTALTFKWPRSSSPGDPLSCGLPVPSQGPQLPPLPGPCRAQCPRLLSAKGRGQPAPYTAPFLLGSWMSEHLRVWPWGGGGRGPCPLLTQASWDSSWVQRPDPKRPVTIPAQRSP